MARSRARVLVLVALAPLAACGLLEEQSDPSLTGRARDAGTSEPPGPGQPPPAGDDRGAVWYAAMCASCHGAIGEGATAPRLDRWGKTEAELVSIIDARMPLGEPTRCEGECAVEVAEHILARLQVAAPSCDERPLPDRQLRLLTRREYTRTVTDLLGVPALPCASDATCDRLRESCVAGACAADPCRLRTFTFDPRGRSPRTVVVAGELNGWAPDAGGGAWPLELAPELGLWIGKHEVPDGTWPYKLVVDGSEWLTDPTNPLSAPDGFGGQNSLLVGDCSRATPSPELPADPAASFPVESRPAGYAFDNHAGAGLASAVHVAEWMSAASRLSEVALSRLDRLLGCDPAREPAICADRLIRDLGRRVLRRPLSDDEVAGYRALLDAEPSFAEGASIVLQVFFSSPSFLYRSELGAELEPGRYRLTGYELASALSYTFWGTTPDDALLDAAGRGDLDTGPGLEAEARRLLADPRAREAFGRFAVQWLGVESILTTQKHAATFPGFDDALRRVMLEETARFAEHVAFDSTHGFPELLTARYTFADARLAALYGLAAPAGTGLARVELGAAPRSGVLGHGSVLGTYAHSDQSSPIKRGVFVRERLLCQKFGIPPPDAGGLPDVDPSATTRERFAMHTAKDSCRACHQYIDAVGFGFERFDAIGALRETENGRPIDATGEMNDVDGFGTGTRARFSTLPELAEILAGSSAAKSCFARQWYRFAHGDLDGVEDECALQDLEQRFAASGFDLRELMIAVVTSPGFAWRR